MFFLCCWQLPGIAEPPVLIVPENQPHKAFLPGAEEEQPQQRTPVATVTRRAEWAKQHKKEKNKREAREGMPTKAL